MVYRFDSGLGHVTGQFESHSDNKDIDWSIQRQLTEKGEDEARVTICGYKSQHKDRKPVVRLEIDLTVGARWGKYVTIEFADWDSTPEQYLEGIDNIINMLQKGRDMYAQLAEQFPKANFDLEKFKEESST